MGYVRREVTEHHGDVEEGNQDRAGLTLCCHQHPPLKVIRDEVADNVDSCELSRCFKSITKSHVSGSRRGNHVEGRSSGDDPVGHDESGGGRWGLSKMTYS